MHWQTLYDYGMLQASACDIYSTAAFSQRHRDSALYETLLSYHLNTYALNGFKFMLISISNTLLKHESGGEIYEIESRLLQRLDEVITCEKKTINR